MPGRRSGQAGKQLNSHIAIVSIVATLVACGLFYTVRLSGQRAMISSMQRTMFVDPDQEAFFRSKCGSDWHRGFAPWERKQRAALMGDKSVRIVIWRCSDICGGLGDRQRGILTSFTLAVALQRAFFIDSQRPVPLHNFFKIANKDLHWVYNESLLRDRTVLEESFMDAYPSIGDYAKADLEYYNDYDVVIQKTNFWKPLGILDNPMLSALRSAFGSRSHDVLAGCFLNYLLTPLSELQHQVHSVVLQQQQAGKNIVALQVRSGDNQVKNSTVLHDLVQVFDDCHQRIQEQGREEHAVFLTTDSVEVLRLFESRYSGLITFEGEIMHVDGFFGGQNTEQAFRKTVLDHLMISRAATLVISRSGFGEFAALRGFSGYYSPPNCAIKTPHYAFPDKLPAGVPATQLHRVDIILKPTFEGRVDG